MLPPLRVFTPGLAGASKANLGGAVTACGAVGWIAEGGVPLMLSQAPAR